MMPIGEVRPDIGRLPGVAETSMPMRRAILFRVDDDAIFQGLAHAASLSFPTYDARIVRDFDADDMSAALLLVRAEQHDDLARTLLELKARMPEVAIGVLVNRAGAMTDLLRAVMAQNLAQGVLPLTLPLKVWLASVWLLLNGGHYLPPELWATRQVLGVEEAAIQRQVERQTGRSPDFTAPPGADALTHREIQVLRLMAQGCQNKVIAVRLDLSEHTVKVHVHNIIRKLGVNNRTQAAGMFRDPTRS